MFSFLYVCIYIHIIFLLFFFYFCVFSFLCYTEGLSLFLILSSVFFQYGHTIICQRDKVSINKLVPPTSSMQYRRVRHDQRSLIAAARPSRHCTGPSFFNFGSLSCYIALAEAPYRGCWLRSSWSGPS